MGQPTAWNKTTDFSEYATAHPSAPFAPAELDTELDNARTTVGQLRTNIALIQRDDGELANESVGIDQLADETLALFTLGEADIIGPWATATAYTVGNVVGQGGVAYVCVTAHTSGTFNTDLSAGKWAAMGATTSSLAATAITFSAAGTVSAATVQAAIEELDTEKAKVAGDSSQTFSVSAATSAAHAVTMRQIQRNTLLHAVAGGSADALTATIASGETALVDGMRVLIEAAASNATTAPTLNLTLGSTATGAKTIKKGSANALLAGDIEGAGMKLDLAWDSDGDCWLLLNPANPVASAAASINDLTELLQPNRTNDYGEVYSSSAGASRKVALQNYPLPRSYLAGGTLSNNGSDATNDIDIAAGACRDSTDTVNIRWSSFTGKQLDASWAEGSAAGMRDTGSIANGTWHIYAILKDSDNSAQILASTSASSPTMPSGYTYFRRIGSILREGGAIVGFLQDGDDFYRKSPIQDVSTTGFAAGTSAVSRTLSVPTGIRVKAYMSVALGTQTAAMIYMLLSDLSATDVAPSSTNFTLSAGYGAASGSTDDQVGAQCSVWTSTGAQIRSRMGANDAQDKLYINTLGWMDRRGRDA